ncbi:uncharacterized protein TRIADDRAFT_54641 [Trichoplax adhaerens]|uniref:Upf1 domain-containing protein n=1 Tax=Trichoplax adhaerens TaxID=10228 RepID=B3RSL3_TRIAD|nr:hypothetical protein TRIADDRAFT_54641 [Trichoplax adhaerens]EDV26532.1 hypothetical protein TRIADDRAFT_54641 [Trichoplax adhaerens]|eukprot:XP_002110528.1 hypothetical protein TRIADDRAFT_54641 [Trichoplax adhaerens]
MAMSNADAYGPSTANTLTFYDPESSDFGGDTQASDYDFKDFTIPSQTQSQSQSDPVVPYLDGNNKSFTNSTIGNRNIHSAVAASDNLLTNVTDKMVDLNFEDDEDEEDGFYKKERLLHACSYCGIHDPAAVVMCNTCKRWFCNGRGTTSGSHIINHLVRAKHREVTLHKDGPLGETVLECYNCACRNIFVLGYIPAKSDSVVVLLCRHPCATLTKSKDDDWDQSQWQSLIDEKCFRKWLVKVPSDQEQMRAKQITAQQINRLEDLWREHPEATLEDLDKPELTEEVHPVLLRYEDAYIYKSIFEPLIIMESDYDKQLKQNLAQKNVKVRWDQRLNKKRLAYFSLPDLQDDNDEVGLELKSNFDVPESCKEPFEVEFVWKATSFDRMRAAVHKFAIDKTSMNGYLYHRLLGHLVEERPISCKLPKRIAVSGLPELNDSQRTAIKNVLQKPLSLIQGPPGTGKTVTSAALVYHLVNINRWYESYDRLYPNIKPELIHLRVIRLCARSRETLDSSVSMLSLHNQILRMETPEGMKLRKLQQLREEQGELSSSDDALYRQLRNTCEKELLQHADVICCTCVGAGDRRLTGFTFRVILIDEATQATEPECMIPIVRGAKQCILVGDHCQLGPVVMCKKAAGAGLAQSLFARLVALGVRPIRLTVQYRMHPDLSEFPSFHFYEGALQNGVAIDRKGLPTITASGNNSKEVQQDQANVTLSDSESSPESLIVDRNRPMFFWNTQGTEEPGATGSSYLNRSEAESVEKIITCFLRTGIKPEQIGVITPYESQRAYVVTLMKTRGSMQDDLYQKVEVASVDAFQGREKDYIILSCVRSNEYQGIGFLNDPRRLNVSITRAKNGLIIIGNARVLAKHPLWYNLIDYMKDKHCFMEGSLNNLRECNMRLPVPRKKASKVQSSYGLLPGNYTLSDLQEVPIQSSVYRNINYPDDLYRGHDLMSYIGGGGFGNDARIPLPRNIILPMPPPVLHFNQQFGGGGQAGHRDKSQQDFSQNMTMSQDATQPFSLGLLTQDPALTNQGMHTLSQSGGLSQDSYLNEDFKMHSGMSQELNFSYRDMKRN